MDQGRHGLTRDTLSHREACYELRRTGRLYEDGKLTPDEWLGSVHRIMAARQRGALERQRGQAPTSA